MALANGFISSIIEKLLVKHKKIINLQNIWGKKRNENA